MGSTHVLFVCSRNQWRSPTAERIWASHPDLEVRSAGTSPKAKRTVSLHHVDWADVIFVMEKKHRSYLLATFGSSLDHKTIHVLNIPDEYQFMDPELVAQLRESVSSILGL